MTSIDTHSPRGIRITRVRVHKLSAPLSERFGWSLGWASRRTAQLVEVETDCGITGWGDGMAAEAAMQERKEIVLGRSPFETEGIYEELRRRAGHQERPGASCCGGLDMALWDIQGKALGLPVSRLMGTRHRNSVRPYVTALYRKDWPDLGEGLAREAERWVAAGYRMLKMKTGYGAETDPRIVRAVREAIGPETGLAVDSNCAYDAAAAMSIGARLEQFGLMWWEEPVLADDLAGYRRLRDQLRIPLAGGETLLADGLLAQYIQHRVVDVVQPEVELIGLTGARRITPLCWLNGIRIVPHNWGTAVRTAAILQWVATLPPLTPALDGCPVTFEFDQTESPFRDAVVERAFALNSAGTIEIPSVPGLGVTVVPEEVERFREELIEVA